MAKKAYIGVADKAQQVKKIYIGVDGVARKVKKGYIGVNGVARLFFSSGLRMASGSFTGPDTGKTVTVNTGFKPKYLLIYGNAEYSGENDFGYPVGWSTDVIVYDEGKGQAIMCNGTAINYSIETIGTVLAITTTGFKFKEGGVTGMQDGTYYYIAFGE